MSNQIRILNKRIGELEQEIGIFQNVVRVRNQTINGLININDNLTKENTSLKEQLEYHD